MKKDLLKNIGRRVPLWLLTLAAMTLVDEYLKEGYVFKPGDLLQPYPTHENIVFFSTVAAAVILIVNKLRSKH